MENTGSRDQLIKSILIMAGVPLAFSVACSLFARVKDRNISSSNDQIHKTELVTLRGDDHGEEENKKFDEIVIEYRKALGELESSHWEIGLLQTRVKKLLKKTRQSLRLIRKQSLKIQEQEAQMLSAEIEFKRKEIVIEGYEREAEDMRALISRLSEEKNDVVKKLEITENTLASKNDIILGNPDMSVCYNDSGMHHLQYSTSKTQNKHPALVFDAAGNLIKYAHKGSSWFTRVR